MHAFLITGNDTQSRRNMIEADLLQKEVGPFDRIYVEATDEHIKIDVIRDVQKRISLKPFKGTAAIVIVGSHMLTREAQNALLKTLEEPPPHTVLYLETQTTSLLLPTIVSRCQVIDLGKSTTVDTEQTQKTLIKLSDLLDCSIGKKLQNIDAIAATGQDARSWVDNYIYVLHDMLVTFPAATQKLSNVGSRGHIASLLRRFLTVRKQLAVNVNPKLAIDILVN